MARSESIMSKFKLHKIVALGVLATTGIWVATGQFSSVGSARSDTAEQAAPKEEVATTRKIVQVAVLPQVEHARVIRVPGQTAADKESVLASRAAGIIEDLLVSKGDRVEKGDVILRLESEGKEAALASAEQSLKQRRAEANAAERLAKSGNTPALQLDAARTALASAQSALEMAKADLDRITVHAPFSGVIDKIHVEEGSAIMQGAEVATLLKLDPIVIIGEVSERELGNIQTGDKADVSLVNGEVLTGTLSYVSRAASPQTRTFRMEVSVANPDNLIPAGMTAEIAVRADALQAVALPRSVVTLHPDGNLGVRSVDDDGTVAFHPIQIVDDTAQALFVAGVPANSRIIVAGQDFVVDGEKVDAQQADANTLPDLAQNDGSGSLR
jgi:multidrug efflux system membrane fusion protein